jgi:hypothetical protein
MQEITHYTEEVVFVQPAYRCLDHTHDGLQNMPVAIE